MFTHLFQLPNHCRLAKPMEYVDSPCSTNLCKFVFKLPHHYLALTPALDLAEPICFVANLCLCILPSPATMPLGSWLALLARLAFVLGSSLALAPVTWPVAVNRLSLFSCPSCLNCLLSPTLSCLCPGCSTHNPSLNSVLVRKNFVLPLC